MTSMSQPAPGFRAPQTTLPEPNNHKASDSRTRYTLPIPLRTFPIPTFIPHNPVSVLHMVYVWMSHLISGPSSHFETPYSGWFSPETRSIHITDPHSIRGLWEQGFYGKGSLSRSEASWLTREKARQGVSTTVSSEDVTRKRRAERQKIKWERARKEREAIDQTLLEESRSTSDIQAIPAKSVSFSPTIVSTSLAQSGDQSQLAIDSTSFTQSENQSQPTIVSTSFTHSENQEHFQLTMEEAFFLSYALGALNIRYLSTKLALSNQDLFSLFRNTSYYPPLLSNPRSSPDDPFLISYVVYHHFRSMGWVVRGGTKFSVDYLLYNRGPVFSHAEFAVLILPSYSDPYWSSDPSLQNYVKGKGQKTWSWMHCVNRVITQVRKTLILVYIDIPAPIDAKLEQELGVDGVLGRYKVREVVLKRWSPNRSRD